ncbi:hypothetical protein [Nocardioides plantarum]|uniref:Uncharacterized protein n=1 Tax=Nocardioides plantarum TaxID=29299 RepID=A0ABV5KBU6_9ACTN|nr:hypothetical protein [Nocardioides plantarum]
MTVSRDGTPGDPHRTYRGGKNTVAEQLAQRLIEDARTVVVADVDDVADMVE